MPERVGQSETWNKLSPNAKDVACLLSQIVGTSIRMELIDATTQHIEPLDLESAISELTQLGVVEEISILKEKETRLKLLGRGRRIGPFSKNLRGSSDEYHELFREIQINKNNGNPEWTTPRWRLTADFKTFAETKSWE